MGQRGHRRVRHAPVACLHLPGDVEEPGGVVTVTTATFTIGIISYLLRAGSLAAALASSLPLWRGFDPIIVFSGDKKKKEDQNELHDTEELNPDSFFEDDAE